MKLLNKVHQQFTRIAYVTDRGLAVSNFYYTKITNL